MSRKKSKRRSHVHKNGDVTKRLDISPAVKTERVKFKPTSKRGTIYQAVFDKLAKLKAGQTFTLAVPRGVLPRTMHNRLNAAMRRCEITPPSRCRFVKRTTANGRIGISCERTSRSAR